MAELFGRARTRLAVTLLLTLGLGSLLAVLSSRRILALERQASGQIAEVTQARGELKELSARLVAAQEKRAARRTGLLVNVEQIMSPTI